MAYTLRKCKQSKGIYLKIYFSFRDPAKKNPSNQYVSSPGYVEDLKAKGIEDPIAYYEDYVRKMNEAIAFDRENEKRDQIGEIPILRHLGYFPLNSILKRLDVKSDIEMLTTGRKFKYDLFQCISGLAFARAVDPQSKKRTVDRVLPTLMGDFDFSYDQVLSCLDFIGSHYQKIVEIFTRHTDDIYILDTSHVLFDCTNFFFEIDSEDEWRRKGPSKENRKDPIIGMGLLLDANVIPIGMRLYPGNESETPVLRNIINEMKAEQNIQGRTIQVADKGLNCSKNIVAAVQSGDGYLFSKSIKKLSEKERLWALKDDGFERYYDEKGNLKYKLKSCIDNFIYSYEDDNGKKVSVEVCEKRIVSFNPKLEEKQRHEVNKMVEKAKKCRLSEAKKSEYGESSKYVKFQSQDSEGKANGKKAIVTINDDAIKRDLEVCGYNMLVTSEIKMSSKDIYDTYHELWRIEETFRCVKSELDARPVYLQSPNKIKGHFLICYIAVLLERLFQFKILENKFGSSQVYEFIRDFNLSIGKDGTYGNISTRTPLIEFLAKKYSLPILHLYIKKGQIEKVLERQL